MSKLTRIAAATLLAELLGVATLVVLLEKYGVYSSQVRAYGTACAVLSCLLAGVQWAPQIWVTFKLGRVGALSVLMITMESIGGVAATLNVMLHATTVLAWITTAFNTLMTSLLMLVLFQIWRKRRRGLSFMFSFMLSPEKQAELEQAILQEIAAEEQAEQHERMESGADARDNPSDNPSLLEGRGSSIQLSAAEQQQAEHASMREQVQNQSHDTLLGRRAE